MFILRLRYQVSMAPKGKCDPKVASSSGLPVGKGKGGRDEGGEGGGVAGKGKGGEGGSVGSAGPVRESTRSLRRWRELRDDRGQLRVKIMAEPSGRTLTEIFH